MSKKIAVVTGGNRGIGLEVCRQLAKEDNIQVILTSRNSNSGNSACETLKDEGLEVSFHQLDVSNLESIENFVSFLEKEHGKLDILVNNAGILIDGNNPEKNSILKADLETIKTTMEVNTYGPFLLNQRIVPLMIKNNYGRIVNMSSGLGQLSDMGGGHPAYRLSKVSLNALTRIFANELQNTNILINTMCPGWVRTDMGGQHASRSVEEGADTATYLSTLPDGGPSGKFFRDRKEIEW